MAKTLDDIKCPGCGSTNTIIRLGRSVNSKYSMWCKNCNWKEDL